MKARNDFETDDEYNIYLRYYYAGQSLSAIALVDVKGEYLKKVPTQCIQYADELISQLQDGR